MNVLYYSYEYPPFLVGGLGTYAMEMAPRYAKMGHNITVFSKNPGDAPTRGMYRATEVHRPQLVDMVDALPIISPGDVARWPRGSQEYFAEVFIYNILSATKTINVLAKTKNRDFDLVAAHDWLSAIAGIAVKRALETPMVFHFHSTEEGRTGNGSPTVKSLERMAGKTADAIITVSYAMRDELVSLGYEEWKINVVPNGVDHRKYNPQRKMFSEDKVREFRAKIGVNDDPMIYYVGRLTGVKGVDTLVKAMPIVTKEFPNVKLVILGMGDQEEMIKHMQTSLNLENNLILDFRFAPEHERMMYYAACDFAVFPSKYEPFGIVCTEAMSMGKPVIVGAKGTSGFREQIVPSGPHRCGSHVDPHSPHDVAEFMLELLRDEELRKKLGKNARKRVLEEFTLDFVAKETMEIYKKVAGVTKE